MITKKQYQKTLDELNKKVDKLEWELLEAKTKNDALVNAITSEDTKLFIYNGETYKVTELNLTKAGVDVDTLNLELVKCDTIVRHTGGVVGAVENALKNVSESLKVAFFGVEKNKEE